MHNETVHMEAMAGLKITRRRQTGGGRLSEIGGGGHWRRGAGEPKKKIGIISFVIFFVAGSHAQLFSEFVLFCRLVELS